MRTVTNYFLVNLSVADLMMSLLNCAFNFIFLLNSHWPFGVVYCTINNFVAHVTVASSVFTLVVISFDRWVFIVGFLPHLASLSVPRSDYSRNVERFIINNHLNPRRPFAILREDSDSSNPVERFNHFNFHGDSIFILLCFSFRKRICSAESCRRIRLKIRYELFMRCAFFFSLLKTTLFVATSLNREIQSMFKKYVFVC